MSQRAANRNVHEQYAQRRVLETIRGMAGEDAIAQHQGGQRHGRRLGDQRTEQWHERETEEVDGHRRLHRQNARNGLNAA